MADREIKKKVRSHTYRGRFTQIPIYIGKFFRMFVYLSDWKVIPMAACIAALVAFVVRSTFFVTMEGTIKGTLALTSVALWNGCFNSIQVVCRERSIIKREHRSGLHITSYVFSHMIYQAFLCLLQTVTTIAICLNLKVKFPNVPVVTDYFLLDLGITLFLITYAADMLSLFLSSIVKSTTAAMTVMPLVLLVQLVFSGILFSLPNGMDRATHLMISNQGACAICALADYNELPSSSGWTMIKRIADQPDADPEIKAMVVTMEAEGKDAYIKKEAAKSNYKEDYVKTYDNLTKRWLILGLYALAFACCSVITLEFIDKDKR